MSPLVTSRRSTSSCNDTAENELPGQHFQADVLLLALGSSQKDLFDDNWLDFMVRVYWLKARSLALQVSTYVVVLDYYHFNTPF